MQKLINLLLNCFYGENICEDVTEDCSCKSGLWLSTEYDLNVLDYLSLPVGEFIVELKQDEGLECETDSKSTMPANLDSFVLSKSNGICNNFLHEISGCKTNYIFHTDTNNLYIEKTLDCFG